MNCLLFKSIVNEGSVGTFWSPFFNQNNIYSDARMSRPETLIIPTDDTLLDIIQSLGTVGLWSQVNILLLRTNCRCSNWNALSLPLQLAINIAKMAEVGLK